MTLRLDAEFEGKVFKDASAIVRPDERAADADRQHRPGHAARAASWSPATRSRRRGRAAFVHIDELTATLDADTQAQVQVLIRELAGALDGREPELRADRRASSAG